MTGQCRKLSIPGSVAHSSGRSAMPRSARASAGGYCYHVINRGNASGRGVPQGRGSRGLPRDHGRGLHPGADPGGGLLPDAEPFSSRALAACRRRPEPLDALAADHARAQVSSTLRAQRPRLARAVQGVSHPAGRALADRRPVRGAEPAASRARRAGPGLAMVEPPPR